MAPALDLSDERERIEGDIRVEALLVGGISPRNLRRLERLRGRANFSSSPTLAKRDADAGK